MAAFDLFRYAAQALGERKLRSALTVLMVVVGVALVTSLNGMNAGFNVFLVNQLESFAPNTLFVSATEPIQRFGSPPQTSQLKINDLTVKTLQGIRHVEHVVPQIRGPAAIQASGRLQTATLIGLDQSKFKAIFPAAELGDGSFVEPRDAIGILLGGRLARPPGEPTPFAAVGRVVQVEVLKTAVVGGLEKTVAEKRSFVVRGILEVTGNPILDNNAFISLASARSLFGKSGEYDVVYVVTESTDFNEAVEEAIKARYGRGLSVESPRSILQTIRSVVTGFQNFTLGIGFISLLVASIGIVTTSYTSVRDRVREIGLLKALGFRERHILGIFLFEVLIIGLLGAAAGSALGVAGAQLLSQLIRFGPNAPTIVPAIQPADILFVFTVAVLLSVAAGLYPAVKAARLNPIVALKSE